MSVTDCIKIVLHHQIITVRYKKSITINDTVQLRQYLGESSTYQ